ncbi:MAG: hypothetical protein GY941_15060 [Planctomycetes bacterium]|nr:hypothetical protein [Planctomycetota bacterium]
MFDDNAQDGPLTPEQELLVSKLSESDLSQIDTALLKNIDTNWRKVARVVGTTMMDLKNRFIGIPDVFYAKRIQYLKDRNLFESQGDLNRMRYSEIRYSSDQKKS